MGSCKPWQEQVRQTRPRSVKYGRTTGKLGQRGCLKPPTSKYIHILIRSYYIFFVVPHRTETPNLGILKSDWARISGSWGINSQHLGSQKIWDTANNNADSNTLKLRSVIYMIYLWFSHLKVGSDQTWNSLAVWNIWNVQLKILRPLIHGLIWALGHRLSENRLPQHWWLTIRKFWLKSEFLGVYTPSSAPQPKIIISSWLYIYIHHIVYIPILFQLNSSMHPF